MSVDTSIQYNGYNSYRFNQNDTLHCYPFGVQNMTYITHSFGAYSPIPLVSSVRAITKFFDVDGIIQTVDHSFSIGEGVFENKEITVPVPSGSVKAQVTFINNESSPWWVATPKTEEGQTATPYAINAYGQLTYITPNGIYTGTITANQIVLASNDETLSERLVTINANQIGLAEGINLANNKVTTIEAGQIELEETVAGQGSKITNLEAGQIELESDIETLDNGTVKKGVNYAGVKITPTQGFENTAVINGQQVKVRLNAQEGLSIYADGQYVGGLKVINGELSLVSSKIGDDTHFAEISKYSGSPLNIYDLNISQNPIFKILQWFYGDDSYAGFTIQDLNQVDRVVLRDNDTSLVDANNQDRFGANNYVSRVNSPNGSTYIGVENGEIFFVVNGQVKERWT